MRSNSGSRWTATCAALVLTVAAPSLATAADADVEQQIEQMQQRMQQVDDQIQAASDQLEAANERVDEQSQLIEGSGLTETRGASSGLPGFLGQIEIGGSIQASYIWNVNHPTDANRDDLAGQGVTCSSQGLGPGECGGLGYTNQGINGAIYPLNPDANTFQLQGLWIDIERPIDEENRAGFRFDTAYGLEGAQAGGINNRDTNRDVTSFYIYEGYVQYLAPIGDGLTLKAGQFVTTIGSEYPNDALNWNITQGNVYQLLEPLNHIGVMGEYAFGDSGFDIKFGGVNGFALDDPDRNEDKSLLWHLGYEQEMFSVGLNGIWGGEVQGFDGDPSGVANLLVTLDPTDRLSFWLNANYDWADVSGSASPQAWGVALAGRFQVTDKLGVALRGEYVQDDDNFLGFCGFTNDGALAPADASCTGAPSSFVPTDVEIWGVTGTVDYLLTDQLKLRGEVRWDAVNKDSGIQDGEFFRGHIENDVDGGGGLATNQVTVGAEVIYSFTKFGGE
jgi:outer membrane murein-binding lipoprotein Lpp